MNEKVSLLKELYQDIASKGQEGDTMLAHINPYEAKLLKAHGGSGTINPSTGLPEFKGYVKEAIMIGATIATGGTAAPAFGSTAFWAGTAATGFSSAMTLGTALQIGGLGLSAYSKTQERKQGKRTANFQREQVTASNKADAARNRYNNLLQKRQRLSTIRSARVQQGRVEAATGGGGLGAGGTSGFSGAVGAIGTQASANLGNINVAQDTGNQISGFNTAAANYGSQANTAASKGAMWSNADTLGGTLMTQGKGIANIFGKA